MPTVVIAGASRGIGLELVRQYAEEGWQVIAGCRNPENAEQLQPLVREGEVEAYALDVASDRSVEAFARQVDGPIDLLIVAAGVSGGEEQSFGNVDFEAMAQTLNVNTSGPLRLAEALSPNLGAASNAKLIALTSQMGSIERTDSSAMMIYRISKAALNEAWKCVALELAPRGITAMVIHPGWVATDMGGSQAPVTPSTSAEGIRKVVADITLEDAGTFRTFEGSVVPW